MSCASRSLSDVSLPTIDDPVRARVAANIRRHRQASALSVEQLSRRCEELAGVTLPAPELAGVELAERGLETTGLVAVALGLGVSVPDLLAPFDVEGRAGETALVKADVEVGPNHRISRAEYMGGIGGSAVPNTFAVSAGRPARAATARLRELGHTTEQLRDRFGPRSSVGERPGE
jgi:hypothetical protein